jgi:hypothetical protein
MYAKLKEMLKYQGFTNWVAVCSVFFIITQLLWYSSRYYRGCDILEIPAMIFFFPLAPLFDPHNGMVRNEGILLYAIIYWIILFVVSLIISRKIINPIIPALALLVISSVLSIFYSVFFASHLVS